MEFVIIIIILLAVVLMLAQDVFLIMVVVYGLIGLTSVVCAVFFTLSLILLLTMKWTDAVYLGAEESDKGWNVAVYEIDGEQVYNLFPMDTVFVKMKKEDKPTRVRIRKLFGKRLVFDKLSILTISLGFPIFTGITLALLGFLRF